MKIRAKEWPTAARVRSDEEDVVSLNSLNQLPAFIDEGIVNTIVETPRGSQNKFNFDSETGLFKLGAAMPAGVTFPFEFGFIPSTLGQDGDPLDILILLDAPTFVGCLVIVRLIGVIEAKQTDENKKYVRNDRIIGVATKSRRHESVKGLRDVPAALVAEIEHFFVAYNRIKGKKFKVLGRFGPKRARELVKAAIQK